MPVVIVDDRAVELTENLTVFISLTGEISNVLFTQQSAAVLILDNDGEHMFLVYQAKCKCHPALIQFLYMHEGKQEGLAEPISFERECRDRIKSRRDKIGITSALARGNINICTYVRTFGHLRRRVRVGVTCAGAGA